MNLNVNCLRVYPDAPRLEPLIQNGTPEKQDGSDRESDDLDEEEPSHAKKKRVVLKRNFRRPSHESKEQSDPLREWPFYTVQCTFTILRSGCYFSSATTPPEKLNPWWMDVIVYYTYPARHIHVVAVYKLVSFAMRCFVSTCGRFYFSDLTHTVLFVLLFYQQHTSAICFLTFLVHQGLVVQIYLTLQPQCQHTNSPPSIWFSYGASWE